VIALGQQTAAAPHQNSWATNFCCSMFKQFHGFLCNTGRCLSAEGTDHSNFIAAATNHLESGDQTYNQAVFQVCS